MATNKILVIDDSRVIRKTVRDMLPEGDFEVVEAKDGLEGVNLLNQDMPALIMLDFILPKLSGWEVYQQIQNNPEFQGIPLVLMSGRKEEVTNKLPEPFEYFEFIEKPFDKNSLTVAIKAAMAKAKQRTRTITTMDGTPVPAAAAAGVAGISAAEVAEMDEKIGQLQKTFSAEVGDINSQIFSLQKEKQDREETIQTLTAKVSDLESEVATLKKQLGQLVLLIKKKLS
jgi:CheY-like chemotaxis protein